MNLPLASLLRVLRRRRLTKHLSGNILKRVLRLLLLLLLMVAINTWAMIFFEAMSLRDAVWLSFTTLTTVGYGDFSPKTIEGRLVTVGTMYIFAITLLSLLAAEVIEWRMTITSKKRNGYWKFTEMSDHIQIINTPNVDTERFLMRLVREMSDTPELAGHPVQLLTRKYPGGLPESLTRLKVLHRTGAAEDGVVIHDIALEHAQHVIILARDAGDSVSDSVTFDILCRVKAINAQANIVVEAVLDENRARFLSAGASSVVRPIRAYPEMLVRALSHPGTERVLEDLFDSQGDSIHRIPCALQDVAWSQVVSSCIRLGIGTPLAYFQGGEPVMQPRFEQRCTGDAVAVLVKAGVRVDVSELEAALVAS